VEFPCFLVFDSDDIVDGGGEAMLEGVTAGDGLAFGAGRALRFRSIDARLLMRDCSERVSLGLFSVMWNPLW